jgi:hypothetical protein
MKSFASAIVLALLVGVSSASTPRDYLVVERSANVARPAEAVWKELGDFCYIGKLLDLTCSIESGSGGVGTVRRLNDTIFETMIAHSPRSYTYSQPQGPRANIDYHGTLAVEAINERASRIVYTIVLDSAKLPPGTDTEVYRKAIEDRFQKAVDRAKALLEGRSDRP